MITTAAPSIDLSWVTFLSEEETEPCGWYTDPCSREATHAGIFRLASGTCPNWHDRVLYCPAHRDLVALRARRNNRFSCCAACEGRTVAVLVRMEALR